MAPRRQITRVAVPATVAVSALAGAWPAVAGAKPDYTATPGAANPDARFVVRYEGSGSFKTRFHATPPNPDEKPDTNDAWDSSGQSWKLKFRQALAMPTRGEPSSSSQDPCGDVTGVSGARGATAMTGRVHHKHVDGVYRELDRVVKCKLSKRPSTHRTLDAT